ncbi:sensor histidine kinase [Streptomyces sp. enrichment culture]|uniref:sensor histidine kinase n=1 Tax=Streptomyces sp. enrichment culture TaxID=1795815 RepID=UPI003F573C39
MGSGDNRGAKRRNAREWAVDIGAFLFAACFLVLSTDQVVIEPGTSGTALALDQLRGGLACAALFLRRRRPVELAVVLLLLEPFSHFMAGPIMVALFTVAVRRPPRVTGYVAVLAFAPLPFVLAHRPDLDDPRTGSALTYFVLLAATVGWGLYVRSRRQLIASLRERADQAAADARREAREDVAREMHDVLAHRLSLLSVHAGALEFTPDAGRDQVARAAGVIRESAHQALQDLREIIGVLRAPETGDRPQPVLADLERLADESRRAGADVRLDLEVDGGLEAAPAVAGRTAYRIVQEGLTNARKHGSGSGAPVTVTVRGGAGRGLTVEVRNPAPSPGTGGSARVPGAGQGLIGLAERALLAGGTLEHGRVDGDFRLHAALPWPGTAPATSPQAAPAPDATH